MTLTVIGRARYSDRIAAYTPTAEARSALDPLRTDSDHSTGRVRDIVTIRHKLRRPETNLAAMIETIEPQNFDLFS
jgi:hypothetical protein